VSDALFAVTFDCADAAVLVRFWADVLGRQVAEDPLPSTRSCSRATAIPAGHV